MKKSLSILLILTLQSCVPSMDTPPTIIKSIEVNKKKVEWIGLSTAFAEAPDGIILDNKNTVDTIVRASNIADLKKISDDTILIGFYGRPQAYSKKFDLPGKFDQFVIMTDTSYLRK